MNYSLTKQEIKRLRFLAGRQRELAALPVMQHRKKMWTDMNDGIVGARPPFAIESGSFDCDFLPESMLCCTSAYGKALERNFLRHIRHHEILNDDHVCPDTLDMEWHIRFDEFGIQIKTTQAQNSAGYHVEHLIKDLEVDGFDMIKPATFEVDRTSTMAEKSFLEETFGDILPVVIQNPLLSSNSNCLTQRLMQLMSMETLFLAMYDCPEKLHALMSLMRDNAMRQARWMEKEGLLKLNNGNQRTCNTCYNFTTQIPKRKISDKVHLSDLWGTMDSQETVGVSPELFHEFFFPYYRDLAEMYGLVYWGCCEPADPIWEDSIRHLPNLKAVSVSRWADQEFMAEALDGMDIVYSRKPNPNFLGVDVRLNEEGWANEIRSTLNAIRGKEVNFEFVVRDVYSVHGDLNNPRRAVEIARQEIDKVYGPLRQEEN